MEKQMSKTVQVKTPLELQTFVWRDNALVRAEDLGVAEIIDIRELSARSKTSLTTPAAELNLASLQPMWG
jgi:hypothetical protein